MTEIEKPTVTFWRAINEGRRAAGQPPALFGNIHELWAQAMQPTPAEIKDAADRRAKDRG